MKITELKLIAIICCCAIGHPSGFLLAAGCFQCPGDGTTYRPMPFCFASTETPIGSWGSQCCIYVLETLNAAWGACQPCYEPSYKKCLEGTADGHNFTEYYGKCLDFGLCGDGVLYVRGFPASSAKFPEGISRDAGYCEHE